MAFRLYKLFTSDLSIITKPLVRNKSQRRTLGKPPGVARSLQQKLEEINYLDPKIYYKVDIGLPQEKKLRRNVTAEHLSILKKNRNNVELEEKSNLNKLLIPLDEVEKDCIKSGGEKLVKAAAEHYAVFDHLFGDAYFVPRVSLDIAFHCPQEEALAPVYRGNYLKPSQTTEAPEVRFESDADSLWTLVLTTPDGHFTSDNSEYLHWFIGNIKGNDVSRGEMICDYLQPFPAYGTGYYRYVFVLYKQQGPIDYSTLKRQSPCYNLEERTFSTYEFYRARQEELTPAGLGFFQADWDPSVNAVFHNKLKTPAPRYSYDFPEHYYTKQKWFPIKQPFNLYLDRYRDEKEIAKEYLMKKLKETHPFKAPHPGLKFPNAVGFKPGTPSWLKTKITKERLRGGRAADY